MAYILDDSYMLSDLSTLCIHKAHNSAENPIFIGALDEEGSLFRASNSKPISELYIIYATSSTIRIFLSSRNDECKLFHEHAIPASNGIILKAGLMHIRRPFITL